MNAKELTERMKEVPPWLEVGYIIEGDKGKEFHVFNRFDVIQVYDEKKKINQNVVVVK